MPTLYIIAGPNGVGKTTFADRYLPEEAKQTLRPNETAPYEQKLLQNLERLNLKIAEFQTKAPSALVLNDQPKEQP